MSVEKQNKAEEKAMKTGERRKPCMWLRPKGAKYSASVNSKTCSFRLPMTSCLSKQRS